MMTDTWRRVVVMTGLNTRRTFNSPGNLLMILVVPIAFSLIIASFFGGQESGTPTVYVVDEDGSDVAGAFKEELVASALDVHEIQRQEALTGLAAGQYEVVVVIPRGFAGARAAGAPTLEFLHGPEYTAGVVEVRAKAAAHALVTGESVPTIRVGHEAPRGGADGQALAKVRTTFGIYLVFAFAALFARGGSLHQEHKDGTLQRMVAGGVAYGEIVAAHVATIFLVGVLQAAVVLVITAFMGTPWLAAGWGVLALTVLGTLFVGAGLAICLSGLTRSAMVMQGLSGGVPPLLAMMGGAFFPLDAAPAGLQQAARINPVYWVMELLTEGYVYQGVAGQWLPLAVLLLIGILGTVIGIQGLRRVEM